MAGDDNLNDGASWCAGGQKDAGEKASERMRRDVDGQRDAGERALERMRRDVAAVAMEAMLYEIAATPKPGLVDRMNRGAHSDMDFFTFMSSAAGLHDCFDRLAKAGREGARQPVAALLPTMRKIGAAAESRMFAFTKGVNTHKGMIFTLGMLCGAAGWQAGQAGGMCTADALCALAAAMCDGICARELAPLRTRYRTPDEAGKGALTKGERAYLLYGCMGIRGEVEGGYPTVRNISLPVYRALRDAQERPGSRAVSGVLEQSGGRVVSGVLERSGSRVVSGVLERPGSRAVGDAQEQSGIRTVNDALVQTLLYLIAETVDTNILTRHDMDTALYARRQAKRVLDLGGMGTREGREAVYTLDRTFIERGISPGGCADLLAVTHFLYRLEQMTASADM